MKLFATIVIGLIITGTTLCSELARDSTQEHTHETMHLTQVSVIADDHIFKDNGVNIHALFLCKRDSTTGSYTYIDERNTEHRATTETLKSAMFWSAPTALITVLLDDSNVDLNAGDEIGFTPLRQAVHSYNNEELVPRLLARGAKIHNPRYHTAYYLIDGLLDNQRVSPKLVEILLRSGVAHCSRKEKHWLTCNAQKAYDSRTKTPVSSPRNQCINQCMRELRERSREVLAIVKAIIGPVSEKE